MTAKKPKENAMEEKALIELEEREIGQRIKKVADEFESANENELVAIETCARILAGLASKMNGTLEVKIPILLYKGKDVGGFKVSVESIQRQCECGATENLTHDAEGIPICGDCVLHADFDQPTESPA